MIERYRKVGGIVKRPYKRAINLIQREVIESFKEVIINRARQWSPRPIFIFRELLYDIKVILPDSEELLV